MTRRGAFLRALDGFKRSPEIYGLELRLNLAQIILRELRRRGWTQRDLAERSGLKESYISRVLHSDANCTFDSVGRILFSLGIRATLDEPIRTDDTITDFAEYALQRTDSHAEAIHGSQDASGQEAEVYSISAYTHEGRRIQTTKRGRSGPEVAMG